MHWTYGSLRILFVYYCAYSILNFPWQPPTPINQVWIAWINTPLQQLFWKIKGKSKFL